MTYKAPLVDKNQESEESNQESEVVGVERESSEASVEVGILLEYQNKMRNTVLCRNKEPIQNIMQGLKKNNTKSK